MRSPCPIACTLDLIGDKWTLLIIRDLMLGRCYFKEFLASPEGISTNILAARLHKLADEGLIIATPDPHTAGRSRYSLTPKGESLTPLLQGIGEWGLLNIKGSAMLLGSI